MYSGSGPSDVQVRCGNSLIEKLSGDFMFHIGLVTAIKSPILDLKCGCLSGYRCAIFHAFKFYV